jgi:hypothetical protein
MDRPRQRRPTSGADLTLQREMQMPGTEIPLGGCADAAGPAASGAALSELGVTISAGQRLATHRIGQRRRLRRLA